MAKQVFQVLDFLCDCKKKKTLLRCFYFTPKTPEKVPHCRAPHSGEGTLALRNDFLIISWLGSLLKSSLPAILLSQVRGQRQEIWCSEQKGTGRGWGDDFRLWLWSLGELSPCTAQIHRLSCWLNGDLAKDLFSPLTFASFSETCDTPHISTLFDLLVKYLHWKVWLKKNRKAVPRLK